MATKLNSILIFGAIIIFLTYQSDVRSKFLERQKSDSNIQRPPIKDIDCILAIYVFMKYW